MKVYGNIQNSYLKKIKSGIKIDGILHKVDEIFFWIKILLVSDLILLESETKTL